MSLNFYIEFYVLYNGDKAKIIAPLVIPKNNNKELYVQLLGQYTKAGLLNFIYSDDVNSFEFDFLLKYIKDKFKNYSIRLYEIPNFSRLCNFLNSSECKKISGRICIRCALPETEDDYYNGLSKSVRQTIRTSYNRLKKDGKEHKILIKNGPDFTKKEEKEIVNLYIKKSKDWYNGNHFTGAKYKKVLESIKTKLMGRDPFFAFSKNDHLVFVSYYIDNQLAAYFIALVDDSGYCIVPTLVHNNDYNKYSPGLLMIYEFICQSIKESKIIYFDLSRGNEEYKSRYLSNPEKYLNEDFQL